jgi:hypothetical protein
VDKLTKKKISLFWADVAEAKCLIALIGSFRSDINSTQRYSHFCISNGVLTWIFQSMDRKIKKTRGHFWKKGTKGVK